MDSQPRLSLDILAADLDSPAALTQIALDHILRPCRRMAGLPEPAPGDDEWVRSLVETPDISSVHLDPVLRGLFLFASLCPWGAGFMAVDVASRPSTYFLDYGLDVAGTGHDRFAGFIGGLVGDEPTDRRLNWAAPEPWPNSGALAELAAARTIVEAAFAGGEEWDAKIDLDTGLTHMRWGTWNDIDAVLRSDVRRRLVWVGSVDPLEPEDTPDGLGGMFAKDGGVASIDMPESIAGLVMLDLAEALAASDQRPGLCIACGRPVLLNSADAEQARLGRPVFHGFCRNQVDVAAIMRAAGQ